MPEPRVNTQTDFDSWIAVVLFLAIGARFLDRLRPVVERTLAQAQFQPSILGLAWTAAVGVVAVAILVVLLSRRLRTRLGLDEALPVVWSATMAIVGAPVIYMASFIVGMLLMLLLDAVGAGALRGVPLGLGMFVGVPLAAYWAGWRFGKWGYFWGGVSFVFLVAIVVVRAEPPVWPLSVNAAIGGTFMLLLSAAAGRAGAARFQASLKKEQPAADAPDD